MSRPDRTLYVDGHLDRYGRGPLLRAYQERWGDPPGLPEPKRSPMAPLAFYGEPERRVPVATTDPETLKQTIAAAIEGQVEETLTAMFDQKMVAVRSAYLKLRDRLGEQNAEVQEALTELRLMIDAPRTRQPVPEELEV